MFRKKNGVETAISFLRDDIHDMKKKIDLNMDRLSHCPDSKKIEELAEYDKVQNGKLVKLTDAVNETRVEVATTRGQVRVWCYIFAALIASLTIGTFVAGLLGKR